MFLLGQVDKEVIDTGGAREISTRIPSVSVLVNLS